jgi:hypothetical protein
MFVEKFIDRTGDFVVVERGVDELRSVQNEKVLVLGRHLWDEL